MTEHEYNTTRVRLVLDNAFGWLYLKLFFDCDSDECKNGGVYNEFSTPTFFHILTTVTAIEPTEDRTAGCGALGEHTVVTSDLF